MKLHGRGLPNGDLTHCIFYRTPGSLPSIFLSQLLSLCKNIMTSANRRKNYLPLPPGGQPGRLPRHSIFIFTPSIFFYTSIGPRFLSNPPESLSPLSLISPSKTGSNVRSTNSSQTNSEITNAIYLNFEKKSTNWVPTCGVFCFSFSTDDANDSWYAVLGATSVNHSLVLLIIILFSSGMASINYEVLGTTSGNHSLVLLIILCIRFDSSLIV